MSALFDTIFQSLKNKLPTINWKFGSVVRTLIADPLARLDEELDKYSAELEKSYDIQAILRDPAANEDLIDSWMGRLGLNIPADNASTGTVIVTVNSTEEIPITENVAFSWGDTYLRVSESSTWNSANMTKIGYTGLYKFEVPVVSSADFPITLTSGTPLNWDTAPDQVQEIYVGSPVTGGFRATAQAKAAILATALNEPSTCGKSAILTGIQRQFGPVISDVMQGPRMVAGKYGSNCSLYAKQAEMPRIVDLDPTVTDNTFTVSGCGVLQVLGMYKKTDGAKLDARQPIITGVLGDYGSQITFEPSESVSDTCVVKVLKYAVEADVAQWLNSYEVGSPVKMIVKVPAYAEVKLRLHLESGEIDPATEQAIVDYVNRSALNGTLTDSALDSILQTAGLVRTSPSLYSARLVYQNYTNTINTSGSMNLSAVLGQPNVPVAMYSAANLIEVV